MLAAFVKFCHVSQSQLITSLPNVMKDFEALFDRKIRPLLKSREKEMVLKIKLQAIVHIHSHADAQTMLLFYCYDLNLDMVAGIR